MSAEANNPAVETTNDGATPDLNEAAPLASSMPFREERFFLVLAIFIGVFAGLAVVCFRITIEWIRLELLGSALTPDRIRMLLAPTLAGLVVAVLVLRFFPEVRGSGVNQTKAALYIYNGFIPFKTAIGKFITSALGIGSGQSLGPEDPSLQIGASIASALGRRLRLSRDRLRLIAPIGAAAGLSAAFNAPISAVLFVIEEVIGRWTAGILGSVVLAAISSVVVARWFLGAEPMFSIPAVQVRSPAELLAYAALGIVGAFASAVFAKSISFLRPRVQSLPWNTRYFQPAVAGLLVGVIGYFGFPQVMGPGYAYMDQALHNQYTWQLLGLLAGLKILATTLSFSSGSPGGMFAPTLFIGCMLGGAVGGLEQHFFSHLTGSIGTYCLVGMGVLFAGFLRAPMTSVFMVLEVSGDYSIIVPVMVANTLAYLISRQLQPMSILDMLSRSSGVQLPSMEEQREEVVLRIEDAMRPVRVPLVYGQEQIATALERVADSPDSYVLVDNRPEGWCVIKKQALPIAQGDTLRGTTVAAILPPMRTPQVYPDLPLELALRNLRDWPFLPVVHRAEPQQLLGVISLNDVLAAYRARSSYDHHDVGAGILG